MDEKLCIKCGKHPIYIKKRGLCVKCYNEKRREEGGFLNKSKAFRLKFSDIRTRRSERPSEMEFIKNYFNHNHWSYESVTFRFEDTSYTPDFYDRQKNVFIEVSASRQAYHNNKDRYVLLKQYFPGINFEIRTPEGKLLEIGSNGRLSWNP